LSLDVQVEVGQVAASAAGSLCHVTPGPTRPALAAPSL